VTNTQIMDGDAKAAIGEVVDPHPTPGATGRFFRIVESSMRMCIDVATDNAHGDPKLALQAALAAGRLAQVGHRMVLDEEKAEREREDHDDKHLRLAGRTRSPHARVRQARAERRLIAREDREIENNKPRW